MILSYVDREKLLDGMISIMQTKEFVISAVMFSLILMIRCIAAPDKSISGAETKERLEAFIAFNAAAAALYIYIIVRALQP